MRALINRLHAWLQAKIHRMQAEYCSWCDGWGIHPTGIRPEYKADASCVECRGSGRVIEE